MQEAATEPRLLYEKRTLPLRQKVVRTMFFSFLVALANREVFLFSPVIYKS